MRWRLTLTCPAAAGRSLLPAAGCVHTTLPPFTWLERASQLLCQVFYEKFQSSRTHSWERLGFAQARICAVRATFGNPAESSRSYRCNVITPFSGPASYLLPLLLRTRRTCRTALKPSDFVGSLFPSFMTALIGPFWLPD